MTSPFQTADQWTTALDDQMRTTGRSPGEIASLGYAAGHLLGVPLNPEDERACDERGVIVGDGPEELWVIQYDEPSGAWITR